MEILVHGEVDQLLHLVVFGLQAVVDLVKVRISPVPLVRVVRVVEDREHFIHSQEPYPILMQVSKEQEVVVVD